VTRDPRRQQLRRVCWTREFGPAPGAADAMPPSTQPNERMPPAQRTTAARPCPALPDELCAKIVHMLVPEALLASALLNQLFARLCADQQIWRQHCTKRWSGSLPPTNDYRAHYMKRCALEDHLALPDPADPKNWPFHLVISVLGHDGEPTLTHLNWSLPLREARRVNNQALNNLALSWRVDDVHVDRMANIGACYLWGADERLCQLVPSLEHQEYGHPLRQKQIDYHGELNKWYYRQRLDVPTELVLGQQGWKLDNGSGGDLVVHAGILFWVTGDSDTGQRQAMIQLHFLATDHIGGQPLTRCLKAAEWPALFSILPWGKPLPV
jgi:hypothetical protein